MSAALKLADDTTIRIARLTGKRDNRPRLESMSLAAVADMLRSPRRTPCTVSDCVGHVGDGCPHKDGPAWSATIYDGKGRKDENVTAITAIILDCDHIPDDAIGEIEHHISRYCRIVHASHSDRQDDRCVRVVLVPTREIRPDEWRAFWPRLCEMLKLPGVDPSKRNQSALYYLPSRPSDADFYFFAHDGELVDVDAVLARQLARTTTPANDIDPAGALPPGQRHAALISLAGSMRAKGCDAETVYAALDKFNAKNCNPPKPDSELREIATYVEGKPTQTPEPGTFEADIAAALVDIRNALGSDITVKREPMFTDATALLTQEFPLTVWAIAGFLTRLGVAVIGAEPKTTKTWQALTLALAVATGSRAFGEFQAEMGVAAYFFAEDQGKQVRNRIRALLAGSGLVLEPGKLHVCPRGKFLDITKDDDLAWIVASCRRLGKIDLLVLDPLRDIHSATEDKSDEMSPVMRRLRLVGELLGCTILVVHHDGKASESSSKRRPGQKMRGSGAIHGAADTGIYISEGSGGNGTDLFVNNVVSQIKGARSAGTFALELRVEDDSEGEAERATWRFSRCEPKADKTAAGDQKTLAWVAKLAKKGISQTRRKLREREDRPLSEQKTEDALNRLIEVGRLGLDDGGAVGLPHTADGKNWNDFAGARGAKRGVPQGGAVGRTPLGVPHSHDPE